MSQVFICSMKVYNEVFGQTTVYSALAPELNSGLGEADAFMRV